MIQLKDQITNDLFEVIEDYASRYANNVTEDNYFGFSMLPVRESFERLFDLKVRSLAYFSMEFGLASQFYNVFSKNEIHSTEHSHVQHGYLSSVSARREIVDFPMQLDLPIYSGGLGVLAGDTLKAMADDNISAVAIGILWRKGYVAQSVHFKDGQHSEQVQWNPFQYPGLIPFDVRLAFETGSDSVYLRPWLYPVFSRDHKHVIPLILLDADVQENNEDKKMITDQLYRSDDAYWKVMQRMVLGLGGKKAVEAFQFSIDCYHLNEGHAAMSFLDDFDHSKRKVFTCHTPVAAGHDRFAIHDFGGLLSPDQISLAERIGHDENYPDDVNLTHMCLNSADAFNAVSHKHRDVMRIQFPEFDQRIFAVTNAVHISTWMSESVKEVCDQYMKGWRDNPEHLQQFAEWQERGEVREALSQAHQINKARLKHVFGQDFEQNVLTIAWSRRVTGYKRVRLLFHDIDRLVELAKYKGALQIILAGKAHPADTSAQEDIQFLVQQVEALQNEKLHLRIFYIDNYSTHVGQLLASGVDVWLNNPLPPFEASGTSGMKAAINGVLQCSTHDGWVLEAQDKDIGWFFGPRHEGDDIGDENEVRMEEDSNALYLVLEEIIACYYQTYHDGIVDVSQAWTDKMMQSVSLAARFNAQRMVKEYNEKMWKL